MASGTKKRIVLAILGVGTVLALFAFTFASVAYRDWAFICENTGSRKGYREWFFGLQTRHWDNPSAIETFMEDKFPDTLEHRWTSYAGTGRNVFGVKFLYGHSRPGPVIYVSQDMLDKWFTQLADDQKKAFYDLLVSGDYQAVKQKVESIYDDLSTVPAE